MLATQIGLEVVGVGGIRVAPARLEPVPVVAHH
jgi:hypothetical protein